MEIGINDNGRKLKAEGEVKGAILGACERVNAVYNSGLFANELRAGSQYRMKFTLRPQAGNMIFRKLAFHDRRRSGLSATTVI